MWWVNTLEKTLMLGKIEGKRRMGVIEDEMVGWHHWLNGHEFEQTQRDGEGQGGLAYCSSWGCKELDRTAWLNNNNSAFKKYFLPFCRFSFHFLSSVFKEKYLILMKSDFLHQFFSLILYAFCSYLRNLCLTFFDKDNILQNQEIISPWPQDFPKICCANVFKIRPFEYKYIQNISSCIILVHSGLFLMRISPHWQSHL